MALISKMRFLFSLAATSTEANLINQLSATILASVSPCVTKNILARNYLLWRKKRHKIGPLANFH